MQPLASRFQKRPRPRRVPSEARSLPLACLRLQGAHVHGDVHVHGTYTSRRVTWRPLKLNRRRRGRRGDADWAQTQTERPWVSLFLSSTIARAAPPEYIAYSRVNYCTKTPWTVVKSIARCAFVKRMEGGLWRRFFCRSGLGARSGVITVRRRARSARSQRDLIFARVGNT